MKTILRIILILLVAAIVAGGFYLATNNSSAASNSGLDGGQRPVMTDANGQTIQPTNRPDRNEGGAGGLGGVLVTFAEIAGITVVVTLLQKAFDTLKRRKPSLA